MSSPEVDWTLSQFSSVVTSIDTDFGATVKRVDRDESNVLEDNLRQLSNELKEACYIGATLADVSNTPIGTEYDHDRQVVVGLRMVGLHSSEYGHVDPDGVEGVPWEELVARVRTSLLNQREWPNAGASNVTYTDLQLTNEAPGSSAYADYYRYDLDVVFNGFEDL